MVEKLTSPVVLGMSWLTLYNPTIDWSNYAENLVGSCGIEICITGVRPLNLEPVVQLCSAKATVRELKKGAAAWFAMVRENEDVSVTQPDTS